MRYLNPKADLTFKKVFGEHPDLVISFLNALLPFEHPDEEIRQVEYLNPELVPQELMDTPEIHKAVTQLEESAFSEAQLRGYEKFWDMVSTAKMHISSSFQDGKAVGLAEGKAVGLAEGKAVGLAEGKAEGLAEGRSEERLAIARNMKTKGLPAATIAAVTGLSVREVGEL